MIGPPSKSVKPRRRAPRPACPARRRSCQPNPFRVHLRPSFLARKGRAATFWGLQIQTTSPLIPLSGNPQIVQIAQKVARKSRRTMDYDPTAPPDPSDPPKALSSAKEPDPPKALSRVEGPDVSGSPPTSLAARTTPSPPGPRPRDTAPPPATPPCPR